MTENDKNHLNMLEELLAYRAIGTVEDIQLIFSLCKDLERIVKKYEAIGTIEEFKALKEKNEPKKPYEGKFGVIRCSCCDEKVGQMVTSVLKEDCMNFCAYCGSKVDWQ